MTKPAQKTPPADDNTDLKTDQPESIIEKNTKDYGFTFDGIKLVKGRLPFGEEYQGKYHHDFEMRLPTVFDELELQSIGLSPALFQIGRLAKCVTALGDIPADEIDAEFIGKLLPDNYSALFWAQEALLKKRKDASNK